MTKKYNDTSYEQLIEQALENAIDDRERAVEAFDKTKGAYDIDVEDPSSFQALMLLGQSIPKLLDLANKSNEQIIRLAQLREKEESREKGKKDDKRTPIDMSAIRDYMANPSEKAQKKN